MSHRNPKVLGVWGPSGTRIIAAEAKWREPLKWDRKAAAAGERRRVFCASIADVFEDRPELVAPRTRLFHLITETPNLDWLLLTKRPQNALRMMVDVGLYMVENPTLPCPQKNLWLGTSVEDQSTADERIPHLLKVPAAVRFLSVEPLLSEVDLSHWLSARQCGHCGFWAVKGSASPCLKCRLNSWVSGIGWCITGGESGHKARPMHPDWARSVRDQCHSLGTAYFFKQFGEWMPFTDAEELRSFGECVPVCLVKSDGRVVRPYSYVDGPGQQMARVGKKAAGRLLDGRTWDEFPTPAEAARAR